MFCVYFISKLQNFALVNAKTQFKDNQNMIIYGIALFQYV